MLLAGALTGCRRPPAEAPTSGIDPARSDWIRVLLFGNLKEVQVRVPGRVRIVCRSRDAVVEYFSEGGDLPVSIQDGTIRVAQFEFQDRVEMEIADPSRFEIEGVSFRGHLDLSADPGGQTFSAINRVLLEEYLLGVIGAEMQSYWEPEALRAQAVASRTYCLFIRQRFGDLRDYDVRRTQAHQMYGGIAAETGPTRQAVIDTLGQVLLCPDGEGEYRLFPTYFASCCGGHTDDTSLIFGDDYVSLKGVDCPYCRETTRSRFYFWPPVTFTKEELTDRVLGRYPELENLQRIERVEAVRVSSSGRVTSIRLTGRNGEKAYLRGEDFRLAADPSGRRLKSAVFTVHNSETEFVFADGRGFGHGAGLCQSGAQALARRGKLYHEILAYYYPASRLVRLDFSGNE